MGTKTENFIGEINCKVQVSMIHIVASLMEAGSNIIQIASVAGLSPIAYLNAYSASKSYIIPMLEDLEESFYQKALT